MMPSFALFLILLTAGERVSADPARVYRVSQRLRFMYPGWDNAWDKPLNVVCPSGSAVSRIRSLHHNLVEDRVWQIGCVKVAGVAEFSHCNWTSYVNDFDKDIDFQCRPNYVMAGMSSYHNNKHEDRRWKYFCCTAPDLTLSTCVKTPELNDWDRDLNWQVPAGAYVTGAASRHDNDKEDRRWSFRYCLHAWDNAWDKPLNVVCPSGSAVSRIRSLHDNLSEDRVWKIGCGKVAEFSHCNWTSYVNDFDQPFDFQCPPNYVMAGMSSYHNNVHEDRRWKYFCCTAPRLTLSTCVKTPELNDWDRDLYWQVPAGAYVTGAASRHDNDKEDRRWSFRYCKAN